MISATGTSCTRIMPSPRRPSARSCIGYPSYPRIGDAQYWLGKSLFQTRQYRDAAEAFLAVSTKYDTIAHAPDALLRLGKSLASSEKKKLLALLSAKCCASTRVPR